MISACIMAFFQGYVTLEIIGVVRAHQVTDSDAQQEGKEENISIEP